MIFIAAMLLCAWIQTHNDNTPAWVYAAVLALGNAAYAIFTGGDLVACHTCRYLVSVSVVVLLFTGLFFGKRTRMVGHHACGGSWYVLSTVGFVVAHQ